MASYDELKAQAYNNPSEFSEKVGHDLNRKFPVTLVLSTQCQHGEIKLCCRGQSQGGTSKDNPTYRIPF